MKQWMIYFHDMYEHGTDAVSMFAQRGADDKMRKKAVERSLEIMGEAAKRIPRAMQPQWPDFPWKDVVDLRNLLSHEYEVLTMQELERIIVKDVPAILEIIKNILTQHGE